MQTGSQPDEEAEANYFAMCILMPEAFVRDEIEKLDRPLDIEDGKVIAKLAKTFKVSESIMTIRLTELYKLHP